MMVSDIGSAYGSIALKETTSTLASQMKAMSRLAGGVGVDTVNNLPFKDILDSVAVAQDKSTNISRRFISGDKNVSMADVLSASQDSSIKFEALRVTRNKMLEITKEILNTQI